MDFSIFILGLLAFLAFQMWLRDRKRRDMMDLAKQTLASGQPLPPDFWERLLEPDPARTPGWLAPVLFLVLTLGFGVAAVITPVETAQRALGLVAVVMGAVALATAAAEIVKRRNGR